MLEQAELPELDDILDELLDRQPETDPVPTLDRVAAVLELMGDPQRAMQVVHVAGTNGKTSTSRMVDQLLTTAGIRTGRFTSPHLRSITERICLDNEDISAEALVAAYEEIRPLLDIIDQREEEAGQPGLTFFEALTCVAVAAFADAPVDVAVLEVGLGGRWDATNVADGRVAVITPIDLDHVGILGDTITAIAAEKAAIIKPGAIAVVGPQPPEAMAVVRERCQEVGAQLRIFGEDFGIESRAVALGGQVLDLFGVEGRYPEIFLPVIGQHQAENAAVALAAVEALLVEGIPLSGEVAASLGGVTSPGRLEAVHRNPTILVDSAHNPAAAQVLAAAIRDSYTFTDLTVVFAAMADKDLRGMLQALEPVAPLLVATRNSSPRSASAEQVGEMATEILGQDRVAIIPELDQALASAEQLARERGGAVLACGSVVTAADAAVWAEGQP